MDWSLPDPMLTVAVNSPELRAGQAAEPKWDGYRWGLEVHAHQVVVRAFPPWHRPVRCVP
ncbi:hypothetical protein GCM10010430_54430 [Kitasatospora cystarginea]|uniref:ATP-dependent DNA ligase family profile domain-containing protein n=1 Tax=Kitasatospora cystarginea TaxID=58350 RepID=A0ABN3EM85_9ACTN